MPETKWLQRLSRKYTPENPVLIYWKKIVDTTIWHFVTKVLELTESWKLKIKFDWIEIDLFKWYDEIKKVLRVDEKDFLKTNNSHFINNLLLNTLFKHIDLIDSLFYEIIEKFLEFHKVTFYNAIIDKLIPKQTSEL